MRIVKYIKYLALSSFLAGSTAIWAQQDYTMQDAVLGLATNLEVDNWSNLSFRPEYNDYIYISVDKKSYNYASSESKRNKTLIQLQQLNQWASDAGSKELKRLPQLTWMDQNHLYFVVPDLNDKHMNFFICALDKSQNLQLAKTLTLPKGAANITVNAELSSVSYTLDNGLHFVDNNNVHHKIAVDNNPHIVYGQSVHRNEFGIDRGIFHSPKGHFTAFYRMDESMVANYPIIDWLAPVATVQEIKYPMAGGVSHQVQLGIYDYNSGKVTYIKTGLPSDQYLTCVTWDPDEKYVYIGILNRAQNHLKLNKYDIQSGELVATLFEEKHDKYVEPQHPLYFSPNKNEFVWLSQKDGYMHAYLYNKNGQLKSQLTKGNWIVKKILGFDKAGDWMYFTSTMNHPLGNTISRVHLKSGKIESFNNDLGNGQRQVEISTSGEFIIDNFRNPDHPRTISLINTKNGKTSTLLSASNTLNEYNNSTVVNVTLETEAQTKLYGKLILPHDFDSSKKYPVVVYVYNGPHLQLVTSTFPESGNLWYDYMTQKGFIVWTLDGRGSANRGLEFEQAVHKQLGLKEAYDQMVGVNYLKSLPFVDSERMGVYGWSFGGFMTTYMMTEYPDVFKVGVAGGPVIDWEMYEIMYTERYMSSPENNKEGYKSNNLALKAGSLKGKLLMIHGADDDVVVWQHSMKFINACVKNNIPIDYFAYPGHKHNVGGRDRVHLLQKIADYFIQNL